MPNLSDLTERQWAQMRSSTSMLTYMILDMLKAGPKHRTEFADDMHTALHDLIIAEWISESEQGNLSLTQSGRDHLKSF